MDIKRFLAAAFLLCTCAVFSQETEKIPEGEQFQDAVPPAQLADTNDVAAAHGQTFRIGSVTYLPTGITKPSQIDRLINVDKERTFSSTEAIESYINDLKQEIDDTRFFENITSSYTVQEADENDIHMVDVVFQFDDSHHMLILPKPGYNSNQGAEFKIILNDLNFAGTLSPLSAEVFLNLGTKENPDDFSLVTIGTAFSYSLPFTLGSTRNKWINDAKLSWTNSADFGLEYNARTGLVVGIPFGRNMLNLTLVQGAVRDTDYIDFGDSTYFSEQFDIDAPIVLRMLTSTKALMWTPFVHSIYNWDIDGIDIENQDLRSPLISIGQRFSFDLIQWHENFKDGVEASTAQSLFYNVQTFNLYPKLEAEIKYFKAWKYAEFSTCLSAFYTFDAWVPKNHTRYLNTTEFGNRVRGALDNQKARGSNLKALSSLSAVTLSVDFPIHVLTTHWMDWGYKLFGAYKDMGERAQKFWALPHKLFQYLDFELQVSPFVDIALFDNQFTGNRYNPKEGLYCAGIEILIYPQKWKSFTLRLSIGLDVGRSILEDKIGLDYSWREPISNKEIYFGMLMHY